ncbi:MAG: hypothetical protein ABFR19_01385 [Pseudomonadota bacterium]
MKTSAETAAKRRKPSLWSHFLLLFFGMILIGNLYVIFSLRETLQSYKEKIDYIQRNANIISDRIYDLDARFKADAAALSKARGEINDSTEALQSSREEVDAVGEHLAITVHYINQLAEAVDYQHRLEIQELDVEQEEAASEAAPAPESAAAVDPEGSMEWIDASGKKHRVQFRDGVLREAVE